uniref:Uncharacterized protein n=1 Tax=Sphaerodactylus townsendi TaxID=933632 RepID=A0ACB8E6U9_9SAUR
MLQDKTHFHEEFVHYLKYVLIIYKREPSVEQVINFLAKFVVCFYEPEKDAKEEEEVENSHWNYLFNFLVWSVTTPIAKQLDFERANLLINFWGACRRTLRLRMSCSIRSTVPC